MLRSYFVKRRPKVQLMTPETPQTVPQGGRLTAWNLDPPGAI
jgi:hypothetical protein